MLRVQPSESFHQNTVSPTVLVKVSRLASGIPKRATSCDLLLEGDSIAFPRTLTNDRNIISPINTDEQHGELVRIFNSRSCLLTNFRHSFGLTSRYKTLQSYGSSSVSSRDCGIVSQSGLLAIPRRINSPIATHLHMPSPHNCATRT